MNRVYACIDLKSFYASVECRERGLNPLSTNLVVADTSRTEKTVCLAITPSLKQYGLSGRARLFEVIKKVNDINYKRRKNNNYKPFAGKSYDDNELKNNKNLELSYIAAPPQMKKYMKYSTDIYKIYLKYIAPEDIFSYSIDEVFCDITSYLNTYKLTPKELISKIIKDVYNTTGITATSVIGTNMFLAKVAMDIVAKHTDADEYGVRIAELDEMSYRKLLWGHKPLTDFWRMGSGITKKLEKYSMYTMGDIARMSLVN
ncbi:MAG: DNA methylase, partial [bacterium]|nr:DNA methylase [bacterium]